MLALAGPKDGWSAQLEYALTAGCLMDLASEGRIEPDETGGLLVLSSTPTGSPPHDLVLGRIAEIDSERLPSTWVSRLAPETSRALLVDACERGVVTERTRRLLGIWPRPEYDVTDQARIVELREKCCASTKDPRPTPSQPPCSDCARPPGCRNSCPVGSGRRRCDDGRSSSLDRRCPTDSVMLRPLWRFRSSRIRECY